MPILDVEELRTHRTGSVEIFRKAMFPHEIIAKIQDKDDAAAALNQIDSALDQVLHPEVCMIAPDMPILQLQANASYRYFGKSAVFEAFKKVRENTMGGWSKAAPPTHELKIAWLDDDRLDFKVTTKGLFDTVGSKILSELSTMCLPCGVAPKPKPWGEVEFKESRATERQVTTQYLFTFEPNSRMILSCTLNLGIQGFLHELQLLPHAGPSVHALAEDFEIASMGMDSGQPV